MENLPSDEVMQMLTQMVIQKFTNEIATKARVFAETMPSGITGREALLAFAASIENTNSKLYDKGTRQ